jgi:hypothetical protein
MYCPNQTIEIDNEIEHRENMFSGFIFHPDLIRATSLNDKLKKLQFFQLRSFRSTSSFGQRKNILLCVQKSNLNLKKILMYIANTFYYQQ